MKAIGYIRVSTTRQAEEGVSIEAQGAKIRAYCELKGINLMEVIIDAGISGKRADRAGYQKVLELCEKGEIDAVVVYSLSRFSRSTRDLLSFVDAYVIRKDITLHSITENVDTSSPSGRFMLTVFSAMAQMERETIVERTKGALEYKKSQGEKTGGDLPYGFNVIDGKLVENPSEQTVIRQIVFLRDKSFSYSSIAEKLNREGYKTKNNKAWRHTQVERVFRRAV
jgi:site-specific DNA recombinase